MINWLRGKIEKIIYYKDNKHWEEQIENIKQGYGLYMEREEKVLRLMNEEPINRTSIREQKEIMNKIKVMMENDIDYCKKRINYNKPIEF